MPDDKRQRLTSILGLLNDGLTKADFTRAFKEVLKLVKDIKDTNSKEWKLIHQAMQKIPDKMMREMMSSMSATEKKMVKDCMSMCEKMCAEMEKKHKAEMGKMDLEMRMMKADREAIVEDALARVPSPITETPESVRDKLETLNGDERLDVKAIKNLKEELEKLRKELTERITSIPRGGSRVGRNNIYHTLTPDGSTKIFSVPKNTGGVVIGSDFPTVLMEGAGFTVNAARNQITLTVDNAPSLNSQLVFIGNGIFNT